MKFSTKLVIGTFTLIGLSSLGIYLYAKFVGFDAGTNSSDQNNGNQSQINQHEHHEINEITAHNQFKPVFILLIVTLTMMIEFLKTVNDKYDLYFQNAITSKSQSTSPKTSKNQKSVKITVLKQSIINFFRNFFKLLVILLLCHYYKVLLVWGAVGKGVGYFIFNLPVDIEEKGGEDNSKDNIFVEDNENVELTTFD